MRPLRPLALVLLVALGVAASAASAHPPTKDPIAGLVDKSSQASYVQRQPFPTTDPTEVAVHARAFAGIVVNETWAQLEPERGRFTFGPLRRSLAAVRSYNRDHHRHPLGVRLRIFGGFTAPGWAKTLEGRPPVTFPTPSQSGTTGRWWSNAYRAAWSRFQHRLAATFDRRPLVAEVGVSSCATLSAEPFVQSPSSLLHAELYAAGWSTAAQRACLRGAFADYSGWRRTPIEFPFNPFVAYTPARKVGTQDLAFSDRLMERCADLRRDHGRTCVLANHAESATAPTISRSAPIYREIDALHARRPHHTFAAFQTNSPDTFGGCAAAAVAVAHHAGSLELWPPSANPRGFRGFAAFPTAELARWNRALRAAQPPDCG